MISGKAPAPAAEASRDAAILPPIDETKTLAVGELGERIVATVRNLEAIGFSGAVLAAKDGKVVAAVAVGSADIKKKTSNTPATLFEIASTTKQFTGAAVMRLVQEGKLKLDHPIHLYIKNVPEDCTMISVRQLLQHTSGVSAKNSAGRGPDIGVVLPYFFAGGPKHKPGTHFEYWNQGYAILSEIIAVASGSSYTDYCKAQLFGPAGMTATCFTGDAAPNLPGVTVATGRSSYGAPRSALAHPYGNEYGFQYRGMGGVVSNVWDLWRWDRALRETKGGSILEAAAQAELFEPGLENYALGWYVTKDGRGKTVQAHSGSVRGFVADFRRLPDDDGCVIVLCNQFGAGAKQIADRVQNVLLGNDAGLPELPSPLSEELAAELAGRYTDQKGNRLIVKRDGRAVKATVEWQGGGYPNTNAWLGIIGDGGLVLVESASNTPMSIERDESGAVASLAIFEAKYRRKK